MLIVELSAGKEDVTGRAAVVCATCAGVLGVPGIPGVSGAHALANVGVSSDCGSARRDCEHLARIADSTVGRSSVLANYP
jgi:hypothetical protein